MPIPEGIPPGITNLPGVPPALGAQTTYQKAVANALAQPAPPRANPVLAKALLAQAAAAANSGDNSPNLIPSSPPPPPQNQPTLIATSYDPNTKTNLTQAQMQALYPGYEILNTGDTTPGTNQVMWGAYAIPKGSQFISGEASWLQQYNPTVSLPGGTRVTGQSVVTTPAWNYGRGLGSPSNGGLAGAQAAQQAGVPGTGVQIVPSPIANPTNDQQGAAEQRLLAGLPSGSWATYNPSTNSYELFLPSTYAFGGGYSAPRLPSMADFMQPPANLGYGPYAVSVAGGGTYIFSSQADLAKFEQNYLNGVNANLFSITPMGSTTPTLFFDPNAASTWGQNQAVNYLQSQIQQNGPQIRIPHGIAVAEGLTGLGPVYGTNPNGENFSLDVSGKTVFFSTMAAAKDFASDLVKGNANLFSINGVYFGGNDVAGAQAYLQSQNPGYMVAYSGGNFSLTPTTATIASQLQSQLQAVQVWRPELGNPDLWASQHPGPSPGNYSLSLNGQTVYFGSKADANTFINEVAAGQSPNLWNAGGKLFFSQTDAQNFAQGLNPSLGANGYQVSIPNPNVYGPFTPGPQSATNPGGQPYLTSPQFSNAADLTAWVQKYYPGATPIYKPGVDMTGVSIPATLTGFNIPTATASANVKTAPSGFLQTIWSDAVSGANSILGNLETGTGFAGYLAQYPVSYVTGNKAGLVWNPQIGQRAGTAGLEAGALTALSFVVGPEIAIPIFGGVNSVQNYATGGNALFGYGASSKSPVGILENFATGAIVAAAGYGAAAALPKIADAFESFANWIGPYKVPDLIPSSLRGGTPLLAENAGRPLAAEVGIDLSQGGSATSLFGESGVIPQGPVTDFERMFGAPPPQGINPFEPGLIRGQAEPVEPPGLAMPPESTPAAGPNLSPYVAPPPASVSGDSWQSFQDYLNAKETDAMARFEQSLQNPKTPFSHEVANPPAPEIAEPGTGGFWGGQGGQAYEVNPVKWVQQNPFSYEQAGGAAPAETFGFPAASVAGGTSGTLSAYSIEQAARGNINGVEVAPGIVQGTSVNDITDASLGSVQETATSAKSDQVLESRLKSMTVPGLEPLPMSVVVNPYRSRTEAEDRSLLAELLVNPSLIATMTVPVSDTVPTQRTTSVEVPPSTIWPALVKPDARLKGNPGEALTYPAQSERGRPEGTAKPGASWYKQVVNPLSPEKLVFGRHNAENFRTDKRPTGTMFRTDRKDHHVYPMAPRRRYRRPR